MAQVTHIELRTGASALYPIAVWAVWLAAAACNLVFFSELPWPVAAAAVVILLLFWPGFSHFQPDKCALRIHADGSALLAGNHGAWIPGARSSRWGTVLHLRLQGRDRFALVCASNNHTEDYRRLLVWNRFPPFGARV